MPEGREIISTLSFLLPFPAFPLLFPNVASSALLLSFPCSEILSPDDEFLKSLHRLRPISGVLTAVPVLVFPWAKLPGLSLKPPEKHRDESDH